MRIGINALSVTPASTGGGTTYFLELIQHLSQIDHTNSYIVFIRSDSKHHFSTYGDSFKLVSIPIIPLLSVALRVLIEHIVLPMLANWYKLDVLFYSEILPLWMPCTSVMVMQNLLYFHYNEVSPLANIKKRRFHNRFRIWYFKFFVIRSVHRADWIITVSENAKREIVESLNISGSKVSVVYHGVGAHFDEGDSEQNTEWDYDMETDYILYVGAISPHKNIEGIIAALPMLNDRLSIKRQEKPLSLVIAGPDHLGYSSHLRKTVSEMGVAEQVAFLGHVPYEKLPFLYRSAKVMVFLSLCESFGLPVLEAMACGCPVVCSNASSLPEIAGNAAVLVDPKDSLAVADAIEALLTNREYRHHLIAMGERRAREFSWTRAASQTLLAIEQAGGKS